MAAAWRVAAAIFVAGGLGVGLTLACSSTPFAGEENARDAGTVADAGADASTPDPCAHAVPPDPPAVDDAPDKSLPPITLALSDSVFQPEEGVVPGFDLDGTCTCETRAGSAHEGADSCKRESSSCDYDGGVDNGVGQLLTSFGSFYDLTSIPKQTVGKGKANLLLSLAGYNGKANDKDVSLGLYQSDGILEKTCPDSVQEGPSAWTPGWCGDDAWSVRPDSIISDVTIPAVSARGFVRNYQLVVRFNSTVALPFSEGARLRVPNPIIAGTLVPLDEQQKPRDPSLEVTGRAARMWNLERGVIAARIPAETMLAAIGSLHVASADAAGQAQFCQASSFPTIVNAVCGGIDIRRIATEDFSSGAKCDAISAGIPVAARPAQIGAIFARGRDPGPCDPGVDGGYVYACP